MCYVRKTERENQKYFVFFIISGEPRAMRLTLCVFTVPAQTSLGGDLNYVYIVNVINCTGKIDVR